MKTYNHSHLTTAAAILEARDALLDQARTLTRSGETLAGDDLAAFNDLTAEVEALNARHDQYVTIERNFAAGAVEHSDGIRDKGVNVMTRTDPWAGGDLHRAEGADLKSRALTAVERMDGHDQAREATTEIVERNGDAVARWALTASAPAYSRAFSKVLRDPAHGHLAWTSDEAAAYRDLTALEQRIGSTTGSAGGYAVPTHLDPAFILNTAGTRNPYRQISRTVQLVEGGTWYGVTTAGTTMSYTTEGAEVGDNSISLGQVSIPVHRAHSWVAGSFELITDAPTLGEEVARMFTDAVDVADATAFTTGNGTNQPTGIVHALMQESTRIDQHATNSAFTVTDLMDAQQALGSRWQSSASWIGSLTYHNRVRAFGDTDYFGRTVTLDQGASTSLLGRPAYEVSNMSTALNTVTNSAWVYGAFENYVIVDKIGGTRVDFVPHLFGDSNRPTGQAGWYLYKRTGAEPTTTTSFVLSQNPGA